VSTVAIGTPDSSSNLLQQVATTTGGSYLTAASADQLTQVYETLGSQLSYDLAIGGSGTLYLILAVVMALLAGLAMLKLPR
jgi:hypothetical protein